MSEIESLRVCRDHQLKESLINAFGSAEMAA